jgi:hypothetical protein
MLSRTNVTLAALALLCAGAVMAQESRGAVAGLVKDSSGAAVAGASVVATHLATNVATHTVTNPGGQYTLLYLTPGRYAVSAEVPGFKKAVREVDVRVADRLTVDLTLEPGGQQETVEVRAGTPLLEVSTGSAGQVIDAQRINLLPLSDGNPFVLSRLAAGTAYTGDLKFSRPFDNAGTSSIVADGAPGTNGGNEFTLDGSPNMAHGRRVAYVPPSDAVEEFKVETATYDAQQGHTAGATVNVVLKSGTNDWHGTAYEFYRSDSISANDFFLNRAGRPRAPLSYNRFGGSLGGPVLLPGYSGRDRTFFMVTYEGLKDEFPEPGTFTVPTEAERRGDFLALLRQGIVIYDPSTAVRLPDGRIQRQPFPGNIIPSNRLSPVALSYLNLYPAPNQSGDAQGRDNYIGPNGRGDSFNSMTARIDHKLSDSHRFFVRYTWNNRRENRGNWTGEVNGVRPIGNYLFRVNNAFTYDHVYTHSASTLVNLRVGFARFNEPNVRQHQGNFDPKSLGFSSRTAAFFGDASYVPRFEFPTDTYSNIGQDVGDKRATNVYSVQPTLTRLMGNHSLRVGYDFRMLRDNSYPANHPAGRYDFNTDFTRGPLDNSPGQFGQQLAAMMLGQPTGGFIDRTASRANQSLYHAGFVQDDWKVSRRLTLNLGLRYEYEGPITERFDRNIRGFDTTLTSPIEEAARRAYAASPVPEVGAADFRVKGGLTFLDRDHRGFWNADKNNFQPRVGFAFQAGDKTVIRGGWGIYSMPVVMENAILGGNGVSPFQQQGFSQSTNIVPTLDGGLTFRANLTDPFTDGVLDPPGSSLGAATFLGRDINFVPQDRKNAQNMRWSAGFQRELPGKWVFEAAYVGTRGYDLAVGVMDGTNLRGIDINAVPERYLSRSPVRDAAVINFLTANVPNPFRGLLPGTSLNGSTVQRQQLLRPFPEFGIIRTDRYDGTSRYHSGQFRLEKRFSGGYSLLLAYTVSRSTETFSLLNSTDARPEKRLAESDIPHRFVASGIWELPFGKGRRFELGGVARALLGGWSVQGIYNLQSGRPLTFGNLYYDGDPSRLKADWSNVDRVFDTSGFYFHDAAVQTNGVDDPAKQRADSHIRLANNIRTFPSRPGIRTQPVQFLDASLIKTVSFGNSVRLQLRFEAINALNHPIFDTPNLDPTSSNFGKTTSQFNIPRNYQLAAKVIF